MVNVGGGGSGGGGGGGGSGGGGSGGGGGGEGGKSGSDELATRVQQLEDRWQQLNSLPTNSEMFRRLHQFRQIELGVEGADADADAAAAVDKSTESITPVPLCHPRQPMTELWHAIQLLNQVENNTAGITRVRTRTHPASLFGGRYNYDSTAIRPDFDRATTIRRPT